MSIETGTTTASNTIVGTIVSVVGGGALAIGATFGLVSSQSALPATVDAPYVVYGNS